MFYQYEIAIGPEKLIVYLDPNEFKTSDKLISVLHHHSYGEFHVILKGTAIFSIEGKTYAIEAGNGIYIPSGIYHKSGIQSDEIERIAIQMDVPTLGIETRKIDILFFHSICKTQPLCPSTIKHLLFYLGNLLVDAILPSGKDNYEFDIELFMSKHYSELVTIDDFAKWLGFSPTHAARIIKQTTGKTFLQYLTLYRYRMAHYLHQSGVHNQSQIAEMVGYKSYAGYYKAMKKIKKELPLETIME